MADTLLLVDDDAAVLRAIGDYFERIGYEVWRDGTGEQAIETYRRGGPPVGLLHLPLPPAPGLGVAPRPPPGGRARVLPARPGAHPDAPQAEPARRAKFLTTTQG